VADVKVTSPVGESVVAIRRGAGAAHLWLICPVLATRYAHWRITCALSLAWAGCVRLARSLLLETVVVVALLWLGPPVYKQITGRSISWELVAAILAVAGFTVLLARGRRRTVFQEFLDCSTPDATGVVPGLAAYLANEVDRLGALYRQAQRESRARKGDERVDDPIQPTVELGDAAEFLKGAVSPEATLSLGPVSIPVGSVLGLVARLMKGPQITGSIHREGDRLILLAHYEGARPKSWRVEGAAGSGASDDKGRWNLHPLIEQMAKRMLADLTLGGTIKFRAVDAFTRAARASLEDGGLARPPLMRQFEVRNCLLEAIAEDDSFDLAWYNLGVVLLALDDKEMARSVFMRARSGNPERWEATYALAVLPGPSASRMLLCDQLISTRPGPSAEARAYDLLGLLCDAQADSSENEDARELRSQAVAYRALAARRAWRALRQAQWWTRNDKRSPQLQAARRLASTCLTNLALSYKAKADIAAVAKELRRAAGVAAGLDKQAALRRKNFRDRGQGRTPVLSLVLGGSGSEWSRRRRAHADLRRRRDRMRRVRRPARQVELLLREAGTLGPLDPRMHQELGALNVELGNWNRAASQYAQVLRVRTDDPDAWVSLARAAAKTKRQRLLASQAAKVLVALAPLVQPVQLKQVAAAVAEIDQELSRRLRQLAVLDGQIGPVIASAKRGEPSALTQLDRLTNEAGSLPGAAWAYYRCAAARFRYGPPPPPAAPDQNAVQQLLAAAKRLDEDCSAAVRRRNTHFAVAKALRARGQLAPALDHAEKATQAAPFSPWAWQLLGDLLAGQAELDEAEGCYLTGLQWATEPDQLLALTTSLASCRLNRLQDRAGTQPANGALPDVRIRLEQLLPLLKTAAIWHRTMAHYWLGLVAFALNDSEQAIAHFTVVGKLSAIGEHKNSDLVSVLALRQTAKALMKIGRLDEARKTFDSEADAIALTHKPDGLDTTVNVGLGTALTLGEILVEARLDSAAALVLQGADLAEARRLIELGRQQLPDLPEQAQMHWTDIAETLVRQLKAVEGH